MAIGFYITNKGRDLITKAATDESKVVISKLKVGDGAKKGDKQDRTLTQLKNQVYEKDFDPELDRYFIDEGKPNVVEITCTLPNEAGDFIINEAGYFDENDNMILYGVLEETPKYAGKGGMAWTLDLHNIITFTNAGDLDNIEFSIDMGAVGVLEQEIRDIDRKVEKAIDDLDQKFSDGQDELEQKFNEKQGELEQKFNEEKDSFEQKFNEEKDSFEEKFNGLQDEVEQQVKDIEEKVDNISMYACDNADILEIVGELKLYPSLG